MTRPTLGMAAGLAYVAAVVAANALTARYGMVAVGFGLAATAGTYAAGAALALRDLTQDYAGRLAVLLGVAAGALLSAWTSTPRLAVASGVTFVVAELVDLAVYTPLRRRGWARAVIASNAAGALVDTLLFLALAGFPVLASAPGQLVGKAWATVAYLACGWGVTRATRLLREPVDAARAGRDA